MFNPLPILQKDSYVICGERGIRSPSLSILFVQALQNTKLRDPDASDKRSAALRLVYRKLFSNLSSP